MNSEQDPINTGYARALFELARAEEAVGRIEKDLHRLKGILETHPELLGFLKERNIQHEGKRRAIGELFGNRIHPIVTDTLITISNQDRNRRLLKIIDAFETIAEAERQSITGEVISATPLDEATVRRIAEALERRTGKKVQLFQRVDASILGGAIIELGGQIIDGSLRRRLTRIREHMMRT
jgi:F-type H+-transporting ATPase subunit delta